MKNDPKENSRDLIPTDTSITERMSQGDAIQRGQELMQSYQAAAEHLNRAVVALNARDYQKAIEEFQGALQHNRESAEGHFYLGLTYFMVGDYENAAASYKRAIFCEPTDPMAHLNLGIAYQLLKR